jgi:hypothetical protein
MGGACYDRDVFAASSNKAFSHVSDQAIGRSSIDATLLPRLTPAGPCRRIRCSWRNPVACVLDVTGSMGDWSKIIYDKLPLFMGEITKQGYLAEPAISFAALGDAHSDKAPIQVCDFSRTRELDTYLSRIWLEGGGGGQARESYELMAYYYLNHCALESDELSLMFIIGDEGFYPSLDAAQVKHHFGDSIESMDSKALFQKLSRIFRIFYIHKAYHDQLDEKRILKQWREALGEQVLILDDPKSVIDVMLGAIALTSRSRSLDHYLTDMASRGQSKDRLGMVKKTLESFSRSLALERVSVKGRLPMPFSSAASGDRWRRFSSR